MRLPDLVESLAIALFAGDLIVRGHASDVAGIVALLLIRGALNACFVWATRRDPTGAELQALRDTVAQLQADVSRVSLVVGITNK
jgi:hypothetical protein